MKKIRSTEEQIAFVLKQAELSTPGGSFFNLSFADIVLVHSRYRNITLNLCILTFIPSTRNKC